MTDQERKVMEMVLEALEWHVSRTRPIEKTTEAIEALRQALAQPEQDISYTDIQMAELIMSDCGHSSDYTPLLDRIAGRLATYRQAIAQPEQEPEAWHVETDDPDYSGMFFDKSSAFEHQSDRGGEITELYTAPVSKPWQSLTDEEIHNIYDELARREPYNVAVSRRNVARAIETALRSKNNG